MIIFLSGCASVPEKDKSRSEQKVTEKTTDIEVSTEKETAISPEVLYLLLTAEIAGQRDQYGVALEGYLQAAKRINDPRVAARAAKIGFFLKDTEKTDEAVNLWLEQDETNLTARKLAVLSALRGSDKALALKHLNRILQDDPASFESTLLELTRVLEKEGKAGFVFDVLEELSQQHPDQAVIFFVQSLLSGQLNELKVGLEKVEKALALQPEWDKALILHAQLAAQSGDYQLAREKLEKVLQKTPDNIRIKKMLAQILVKQDALDEAVQMYQGVLKIKPDDGESQFAIALILLQQENNDEALEYLNKLVYKPDWDAQASFYIGRIEFIKKNLDIALVWFDKVTHGPYVFDASMAGVSVLLSQKKHTEAEQRLVKISSKFPDQKINILLLEVELYSAQKNHDKAFNRLTDALKQFPEDRDLLYTRSLVAEKLDKLDLVEQDLKKILKKNPKDASALNALGYTLADKTDRYDEAETYLQQAIQLQPDEAVIIDSLGWLKFKQGKTAEALKHLRKAYDKQPESEIAAHIAEVLWTLGEKSEAKEIIINALKKSPDDEFLLKFKHQYMDSNE